MPLLSHFYGLHPWDVDRLTYREVSEYLSVLQQIESQGASPWQLVHRAN